MEEFKILIGEKELQERIRALGEQISQEIGEEELVVISILRGAIFFTTALTMNMKNKVKIDFIQTASYGNNRTSNHEIKLLKDITEKIEGKHVLIVEDIIDTGYTLSYVKEYLKEKNPLDIKIAVLLDKPERREVEVAVDYVGFTIPNKFVVGFGFDIENCYRNLPYIGYVED